MLLKLKIYLTLFLFTYFIIINNKISIIQNYHKNNNFKVKLFLIYIFWRILLNLKIHCLVASFKAYLLNIEGKAIIIKGNIKEIK